MTIRVSFKICVTTFIGSLDSRHPKRDFNECSAIPSLQFSKLSRLTTVSVLYSLSTSGIAFTILIFLPLYQTPDLPVPSKVPPLRSTGARTSYVYVTCQSSLPQPSSYSLLVLRPYLHHLHHIRPSFPYWNEILSEIHPPTTFSSNLFLNRKLTLDLSPNFTESPIRTHEYVPSHEYVCHTDRNPVT